MAKHQTRWTGFDDKILSLYARGLTVREIQSHREEMYGTDLTQYCSGDFFITRIELTGGAAKISL